MRSTTDSELEEDELEQGSERGNAACRDADAYFDSGPDGYANGVICARQLVTTSIKFQWNLQRKSPSHPR